MDFFTADLHLGHDKIRTYCGRPFGSVEEMDETIIENWNKRVRKGNHVYVLGDFCFRSNRAGVEQYRKRLNGYIHLVLGNHDRVVPAGLFDTVDYMRKYRQQGIRIILCHYAMRVWDGSHHGTWHLFGHSHGQLPSWGKSFDIGVDPNAFTPLTLDEVVERMEALPDHGSRLEERKA